MENYEINERGKSEAKGKHRKRRMRMKMNEQNGRYEHGNRMKEIKWKKRNGEGGKGKTSKHETEATDLKKPERREKSAGIVKKS